jgi:hypothetical protein
MRKVFTHQQSTLPDNVVTCLAVENVETQTKMKNIKSTLFREIMLWCGMIF